MDKEIGRRRPTRWTRKGSGFFDPRFYAVVLKADLWHGSVGAFGFDGNCQV